MKDLEGIGSALHKGTGRGTGGKITKDRTQNGRLLYGNSNRFRTNARLITVRLLY